MLVEASLPTLAIRKIYIHAPVEQLDLEGRMIFEVLALLLNQRDLRNEENHGSRPRILQCHPFQQEGADEGLATPCTQSGYDIAPLSLDEYFFLVFSRDEI